MTPRLVHLGALALVMSLGPGLAAAQESDPADDPAPVESPTPPVEDAPPEGPTSDAGGESDVAEVVEGGPVPNGAAPDDAVTDDAVSDDAGVSVNEPAAESSPVAPEPQPGEPPTTDPPAARVEADPRSDDADAPARSLTTRYLDALAGSWAGTGILGGGVGAVGTLLGLGAGCAFESGIGCVAGTIGGSIFGISLGWIVGPGVGTALGAGLDFSEGLAMWALGLGSNLVVLGVGALVGLAADAADNTWGLGRVWGMITGAALGALAQVFLTPLYAVLFFEDRDPTARRSAITVAPFLAPTRGGASMGVQGAF